MIEAFDQRPGQTVMAGLTARTASKMLKRFTGSQGVIVTGGAGGLQRVVIDGHG